MNTHSKLATLATLLVMALVAAILLIASPPRPVDDSYMIGLIGLRSSIASAFMSCVIICRNLAGIGQWEPSVPASWSAIVLLIVGVIFL